MPFRSVHFQNTSPCGFSNDARGICLETRQIISKILVFSNSAENPDVGCFFRKLNTSPHEEESCSMHELLIALAFIGLVIAPAIVASSSNIESDEK